MTTTEKASHTPGPWKEYAPAIWNDAHTEEVVDENYRFIEAGRGSTLDGTGGFHLTGFIRPEDARLIAAAPEMLEALERLHITFLQRNGLSTDDREAIAQAWVAIRRAKGEL